MIEPGWDLYNTIIPKQTKNGQTVILSDIKLPLTDEYIKSIRDKKADEMFILQQDAKIWKCSIVCDHTTWDIDK